MDQTATNNYSPMDLVKSLNYDRKVLEADVSVSENTREVQIYIKLRFWHRIKAVLFSDYGHRLQVDWGMDIISKLPEGTALKIKLIV